MNKWKVALCEPDLGRNEIIQVSKVIRSKWLTMGRLSEKFEAEFAKFLGVRYAVFTSSATAGLHLAGRALNLKPGDEVICPALTFVATVNSILYVGAKPVFADVSGKDDFNISAGEIESKITPRTRALMVVHYAGYPCQMDKIKRLAAKFKLAIIEDAAHALGARLKNKNCGSWGDLGVFSFFSNKNMTTGEGGMVVTNQPALAARIRLLRSHGMNVTTWKKFKMGAKANYDVLDLGYNYRPSEVNAALGLSQLQKLTANNRQRAKLTQQYRRRLESVNEVTLPFLNSPGQSAYHIFPLLLANSVDRDRLIAGLKKRGIQASIHYPPVHKFLYYRRIFGNKITLPNTEYVGKHQITLPLFPQMKQAQLKYVVDSLKQELACR
ncbi:DegT/DnrJ/EryC1/StrS family aminotransferase [Candidatus Omnitrophota bacterium]